MGPVNAYGEPQGPPIDLDGTSSAGPDDPVLEWRGADERRDVTLNSSDPAVAFVGITYRRTQHGEGRPFGPWRVEYAAVHSWTSSTRRGVGATTRHVLYSADGPMPNLDILALRDMPAWLTRAIGDRAPDSEALEGWIRGPVVARTYGEHVAVCGDGPRGADEHLDGCPLARPS